MSRIKQNNIPVIYYHSVGNHSEEKPWSFLSVKKEIFLSQMNFLKRNNYYTCNWDELYDHIQGIKKLPEKTVMIHFDDGFLDNWTTVFPIMKNLNLKFSILVSCDFIDQSKKVRKFIDNPCEENLDNWWGYLNIEEMKLMEDSKLCDIQFHAKTHTWYENSPEIIDIYNGKKMYPHLLWNSNETLKPKWLKYKKYAEHGYPVFSHSKSLELEKRFIPSQEMVEEMLSSYSKDISVQQNISKYKKILFKYMKKKNEGRFEKHYEKEKRLHEELHLSRNKLSKLLNKDINYLVFPGGGNSRESVALTKKYGYRLISKGTSPNGFKSLNFQISRYAGFHKFKFLNRFMNYLLFIFQLNRAKNTPFINLILKLKKYV